MYSRDNARSITEKQATALTELASQHRLMDAANTSAIG
jgi:hypothetical protein